MSRICRSRVYLNNENVRIMYYRYSYVFIINRYLIIPVHSQLHNFNNYLVKYLAIALYNILFKYQLKS